AHTKEFVEIEDEEMVTVTSEKVIIQNFAGDIVERSSFEAQVDASDIEKGTYPFYMLKEIDEQPIIMRRIAQKYVTEDNRVSLDQ
ncbi:glutamine--fructose-6-phosphate aminotransferase, partial [Enterococcus faecium]|nr:glutamine--fructose-6-phosphate aminotransferase [Enterococcus faecium]